MKAGMGDGGPCHPRDNIALRWLAEELDLGYDLFSAIMGAREIQAKNLAQFLVDISSSYGQQLYIHGKTFKPDVPYCDGSYSLLVGHYVKAISGRDPIYIDPHTDPVEGGVHGTILLAHNSGITYNYMSRQDIKEYCDFLPGSRVVDPWRSYKTADPSIEVIYYGNTRSSS
jgi:UDPglucose 6-dehydrogenase